MTDSRSTVAAYNDNAKRLAEQYESKSFEQIHTDLLSIIPEERMLVLDVGAGSGRDSAWFADRGHDVVAVEPSIELRKAASELHKNANISWLDDSLPALKKAHNLGIDFDLIWLSAVWMHVAQSNRESAFRKLAKLLRPGGQIMLSLRHGPPPENRVVYPVTRDEVTRLAHANGLSLVTVTRNGDQLNRDDVWWENVVFQLPDDGTGAFPLLRNIIINDVKASTYKLALLRALIRVADGASGYASLNEDGTIKVPLGLVALYWIRLFKPLLDQGFRQAPSSTRDTGLGFVKQPFRELKQLSSFDLRVGMRFQGDLAKALRYAVRDVAKTIRDMPANYITYPGSDEQVFQASYLRVPSGDSHTLDRSFFESYGYLTVPAHLWTAISRYAVWIEPLLINEWVSWMQKYDGEKAKGYDRYYSALQWLDAKRDTGRVRQIVRHMQEAGVDVRCIWTGDPIRKNYDIDHCMPFARWSCNDLWNLLPTSEKANRKKSDSLPSASALADSYERLTAWWGQAYLADQSLMQRFEDEVSAALPMVHDPADPHAVFVGVEMVRKRLRRDQQIPEWEP